MNVAPVFGVAAVLAFAAWWLYRASRPIPVEAATAEVETLASYTGRQRITSRIYASQRDRVTLALRSQGAVWATEATVPLTLTGCRTVTPPKKAQRDVTPIKRKRKAG